MPASKLEEHPWLRRLYAGYAFSIDYREARGHAYMLFDQEVTERVTKRPQSGACLHCHASIIPTYRRLGMEAKGEEADAETLAADFNWPAVMEGFRARQHDGLRRGPCRAAEDARRHARRKSRRCFPAAIARDCDAGEAAERCSDAKQRRRHAWAKRIRWAASIATIRRRCRFA